MVSRIPEGGSFYDGDDRTKPLGTLGGSGIESERDATVASNEQRISVGKVVDTRNLPPSLDQRFLEGEVTLEDVERELHKDD